VEVLLPLVRLVLPVEECLRIAGAARKARRPGRLPALPGLLDGGPAQDGGRGRRKYFVQELIALPDPGNRAWRKKQLEKIVQRIQDNAIGRADYSLGHFVEDVKCACVRESVRFDNDLFSELAG
jgi:hypothetical protein